MACPFHAFVRLSACPFSFPSVPHSLCCQCLPFIYAPLMDSAEELQTCHAVLFIVICSHCNIYSLGLQIYVLATFKSKSTQCLFVFHQFDAPICYCFHLFRPHLVLCEFIVPLTARDSSSFRKGRRPRASISFPSPLSIHPLALQQMLLDQLLTLCVSRNTQTLANTYSKQTYKYIHIRKLTITNSQWRIQKVEGASITLSSIILLLWLHFCRRLCARHYALLFSSAVLVANLINMRAFIQINQRQSNRLRGVGPLTPQFPHSFIFPSPSTSLSFLFAYRMCFMRLCILWYINLS